MYEPCFPNFGVTEDMDRQMVDCAEAGDYEGVRVVAGLAASVILWQQLPRLPLCAQELRPFGISFVLPSSMMRPVCFRQMWSFMQLGLTSFGDTVVLRDSLCNP